MSIRYLSGLSVDSTVLVVDTVNDRVGIGTASPAYKLDVSGALRATGTLYSDNGALAGALNLGQVVSIGSSFGSFANLVFTMHNGGGFSDIMKLQGNGNVGIDTTSPAAKLQIGNGTSNSPSSVAILSADGGNAVLNALSLVNSRAAANGNGTSINFHNANNYGATGRIVNVLDSGTNASLRFSVYNSTDDALVERITLLSSGNVGIGTTGPSAKLVVSNGGATGYEIDPASASGTIVSLFSYDRTAALWRATRYSGLDHRFEINGTTEAMRITDAGNVGIGTTAPQKPLEVITSASNFASVGVNTIAIGEWTGIHFGYREANNSYRKSAIVFERTGGAAEGKIHFLNNIAANNSSATLSDSKMVISDNGNVGIGTTAPGALLQVGQASPDTDALIRLSVAYTGSTPRGGIVWHDTSNVTGKIHTEYNGTTMTSMVFGSLYNSGYNSNPLMFIRGDGNVGIGTTSPAYQLTLNKNDNNYLQIRSSDTGAAGIYFGRQNDSVRGGIYYDNNADALYFQTNNLTTNTVITSAGNVGIGTTTPLSKLDVSITSTQALFIANESGTISDGDLLGAVSFGSRDGSTYSSGGITNIRSYATATYNTGSVSGDMRFYVSSSLQNTTQAALFGTEAMRIASSGNLLIGTTADGGYKLDVNGNTNVAGGTITAGAETTYAFRVLQGKPLTLGGDSNYAYIQSWSSGPLVINSQGNNVLFTNASTNVGIGTANPLARLNIWTPSATGQQVGLRLNNPFGFDNLNTGAKIVFSQDRSTSEDIPMGELGVGQGDAATSVNGYMYFSTKGSNTMGERMRITAGGNVLINTTADAGYKLDVNGTGRFSDNVTISSNFPSLILSRGGTTFQQDIRFQDSGANRWAIGQAVAAVGNALDFYSYSYGQVLGLNYTTGLATFVGNVNVNNTITAAQSTAETSAIVATSGWSGTINNPIITFGRTALAVAGAIGYDDPNTGLFIGTTTNHRFAIRTNNVDRLTISATGAINFSSYGSGTITGTPTYNLGVDSSGNIIELPGGVVDGSGTANYVTKWSDANTVTNSSITDDGTTVTATATNFVSQSNLGTAYTSFTTSGTTAIFDTITRTGSAIYQIVIVANPNSAGSGSYQDFYYGKLFVGTGYNGSIVAQFINYHQESPMPRGLYGSGGGDLTVTAVMLVSGSEVTEVASGTSYTIRIKIAGYNVAGAGTVVRLQSIM